MNWVFILICDICPRHCRTDRDTNPGFCGMNNNIKIARAAPHFWEEPCISGEKGSGTVFFSGCNLKCIYCQNRKISHERFGKDVSDTELMKIFDSLIEKGVNNINLVTPTHYSLRLQKILREYKSTVPVVYNSSGYESVETLKGFEGLVDIYLPDIKYYNSSVAVKYSSAPHYFETAAEAVAEMYRQVGNLELNNDGIAVKGIIVRHLVLPGNISQTRKIFDYLSQHYPPELYISVMSQYTPYGPAKNTPPLNRKLSSREYSIVKKHILGLGFENCYFQDIRSGSECFIPDFNFQGVDLS